MENINFNSCIYVHEKLFFVSTDGYLMQLDDLTGIIKIIAPYNLRELRINQVAYKMLLIGDSVYFFEYDGSILYEYNYKTNYCFKYALPKLDMVNYECFSGIYYYNRKIYLFTKNAGRIYSFDVINKKLISIFNDKNCGVNCSVVIDDEVYIAGKKNILKYSLKTNSYINEINLDEEILWMNYDNSYIYIINATKVIKYDKLFKRKHIIYDEHEKKRQYNRILITPNKYFLLPILKKEICIIDKKTGVRSFEKEPLCLAESNKNWSKYAEYFENENYIWSDNRRANYVMRIDKKSESIDWIYIKDVNVYEKFPYIKGSIARKEVICESALGLKGLIKCLLKE